MEKLQAFEKNFSTNNCCLAISSPSEAFPEPLALSSAWLCPLVTQTEPWTLALPLVSLVLPHHLAPGPSLILVQVHGLCFGMLSMFSQHFHPCFVPGLTLHPHCSANILHKSVLLCYQHRNCFLTQTD